MANTHERWMRLALALGRRGLGRVWPNPAVGCVLVKDGRVLARGWTQDGGRPHAEIHALNQVLEQGDAKGATAYVSLEPCAHTGKTGPCAQALIDARIARVVVATGDPDPRVAGKGNQMLRAAGVDVVENVLKSKADRDHLGFFKRINNGLPMVTLKLASSLDGRIATQTGDSRWITGSAARRQVHLMRSQHDAIMIGSGTAIADNPDLQVRGLGLAGQSPVRVVLDTHLKMNADSRLMETALETPVWLCHGQAVDPLRTKELLGAGAILVLCDENDGRLDAKSALTALAAEGITRVFCEGGGSLAASLMQARLVDQVVMFHAGVMIGADAVPNMGAMGLKALSDAPRMTRRAVVPVGDDILSVWDVNNSGN